MNILFDIGHPAHVHLFKNFIQYLKKNTSYQLICTTRDKEITNLLMQHYQIDYICLSKPRKGLWKMFLEMIIRDLKIFRLHRKYRFDVAFGTSVSIAHLSLFTKVRSYNFNEDDDDVVPLYTKITYPFTTKIINPDCIRYSQWRDKRVLVNSYHELAYLHPNHFTPDRQILAKYGLEERKYVVVRFSALQAHHDRGAIGITQTLWDKIEKQLTNSTVIKSIERDRNYAIEPWDMHHVLAFAQLLISDSQTMTIEAAVLGVPSIRINTFIDKSTVIDELENKFELTYGFFPSQEEKILDTLSRLLNNPSIHNEFLKKRDRLLKSKIDFCEWMIEYFQREIQ